MSIPIFQDPQKKYGFPLPPYSSQIGLVEKIIEVCSFYDSEQNLNHCKNSKFKRASLGLLESPTGTGKSMAMVCGLTTFLESYRSKPQQQLQDQFKLKSQSQCNNDATESDFVQSNHVSNSKSNVPAWVKKHETRMHEESWLADIEYFRKRHEARIERLTNMPDIMQNFQIGIGIGVNGRKYIDESAAEQEQIGELSLDVDSGQRKNFRNSSRIDIQSQVLSSKVYVNLKDAVSESKVQPIFLILFNCNSNLYDFSCPPDFVDEVEFEPSVKKLQVIFCSRTHSQLSQFCKEIRKQRAYVAKIRQKLQYSTESSSTNTKVDLSRIQDLIPDPDEIKVVTLGSRVLTCTNPIVPKTNSTQCNEACQRLRDKQGCKMKSRAEKVSDQILTKIMPLDEAIQTTASDQFIGGCAYYGTRMSVPDADFILVPYSCILDAKTRQQLGIDIENNIVVFDEAHNVFDACSDCHSCMLTLDAANACLEDFEAYIEKYAPSFVSETLADVSKLQQVMSKITKSKAGMFTIAEYLLQTKLDDVDLSKILHFVERRELSRKLRGFSIGKAAGGDSRHCSAIYNVITLLQRIVSCSCDDRVLVTQPQQTDNSQNCHSHFQGSIKLINLNVEQYLLEFLDKARAVLFVGGTMEPKSEYAVLRKYTCQQYQDQNQHLSLIQNQNTTVNFQGPYFEFSAPHIIPNSHIFARYITSGINGVTLDFRSATRMQPQMLAALHSIIDALFQQLSRSLGRGGIIIFFPSFDFLSKFVEKYYAKNVVSIPEDITAAASSRAGMTGHTGNFNRQENRIRDPHRAVHDQDNTASLPVFVESRSCNIGNLLNHFESSTKTKTCLLYTVVGGKVSEGINFQDDMCRCVVQVGLPYPDARDPTLVEKMKFLDKRCQAIKNSSSTCESMSLTQAETHQTIEALAQLSGRDYYQMKCMKAINQCIGRSIRHIGDWSSIFLLDHRYAKHQTRKDISAWLRDLFLDGGCLDSSQLQDLDNFYRIRASSQQKSKDS